PHGESRLIPRECRADERPVEMVSWDDCRDFCKKLGEKVGERFGLPAEAEWEWSCRAGTTTAYHAGEGPQAMRRPEDGGPRRVRNTSVASRAADRPGGPPARCPGGLPRPGEARIGERHLL